MTFSLMRKGIAVAALAGAMVLPMAARAEQPLSIIVAYAPGGSTDTLARTIGQKLSDKIGQSVIIDNRPGATGQLGSRYVAAAAPDGNTLQVATQTTHAVAPSLYASVGYKPMEDFTPITYAAWTPLVLTVHPDFPAKNVQELIAYLKARPGAVNYATGGRGDGSHLSAMFFSKVAEVSPVAIPFNGEGAAIPQMLGGHIQIMFMGAPVAAPLIKEGKLRALAVTSKVRSPNLPDVPTLDEAGLKGFEMVNWWGFFGPAKMSPELIKKYNAAFNDVLKDAEVRRKLESIGFVINGSTAEEFKTFVAAENVKWADVIKSQGLKPE
jgi:tripartite-type tricarboxylate transporter receptor subunit TctC